MSRNYSVVTIKTLFGQAHECAYPACNEPLIFADRGAVTVVAEIAHIRSESTKGPRHDSGYVGDINAAENLLLLCGKHHPPVDRHESAYPIRELLEWKRTQVRSAGSGTPISAEEARRFIRLTAEERVAIAQIARLAERVEIAYASAESARREVEQERLKALQRLRVHAGPMYELDSDGNDVLDEHGRMVNLADRMEMSPMEAGQWQQRANQACSADLIAMRTALGALAEEVSVLRMMNGQLGAAADTLLLTAEDACRSASGAERSRQDFSQRSRRALKDLWTLAIANE